MIIRKLFKAEMAHAVPEAYTERCHFLHGHSYQFELFLKSHTPNPTHMVIDFKAIKDMGLHDLFDSFDHSVVLWNRDPVSQIVSRVNPERHIIVPFIPTAEMLAKALFFVAQALLETSSPLSGEKNVLVDQVSVHETETGLGTYRAMDVTHDRFPKISFHRWTFSQGIQSSWKNKDWYQKVLNRLSKVAVSR